jgi:hypothetical protein
VQNGPIEADAIEAARREGYQVGLSAAGSRDPDDIWREGYLAGLAEACPPGKCIRWFVVRAPVPSSECGHRCSTTEMLGFRGPLTIYVATITNRWYSNSVLLFHDNPRCCKWDGHGKKISRGEVVRVRVSDTELATFQAAAELAGLSLSEWSRQVLLGGAGFVPADKPNPSVAGRVKERLEQFTEAIETAPSEQKPVIKPGDVLKDSEGKPFAVAVAAGELSAPRKYSKISKPLSQLLAESSTEAPEKPRKAAKQRSTVGEPFMPEWRA